jgi:hypothetical protein
MKEKLPRTRANIRMTNGIVKSTGCEIALDAGVFASTACAKNLSKVRKLSNPIIPVDIQKTKFTIHS